MRQRRLGTGLLVALGYVSSAGSLSTDMYTPAFPDIAESFGIGASEVQLTLTSYLIGSALGQLVIGTVSDALGRRRTMVVALACFALCCWGASLSPTLWALVLVRGIQGLCAAGGVVVARAVVADLAEPARAVRAFGVVWGIIALGPAIANPLAGWLTGIGGWRLALMGLATLATLMGLVALLVVPESLPAARRHPLRFGVLSRNLGRLARRPAYLGFVLAFACGYGALIGYLGSASFIVQGVLGLPPLGFSATFAVGAIAIMLGSWGSGRISHRIRPVMLLRIAQGVLILPAGAILLVLSLTATLAVWDYVLLIVVLGVGFGTVMSVGSSLALGHAAGTAGAGSALLGFTQFAVGAIASPLGGILGSGTAVPTFVVVVGFTLLSLGFGLLAHRAERRSGQAEAPLPEQPDPRAAV